MKMPYISVVFDPAIARKRQKKGETVIYGDAVNEPILRKAHVDNAKIVIISIGDLIPALAVTEKVRILNQHAIILVRTKYVHDIEELYKLGANQVVPEEFETTINLFERVLKNYLLPRREINVAIERIRQDNYGIFREKDSDLEFSIMKDLPNIEIIALKISDDSTLIEKSLAEVNFRKVFGVTVVALKRQEKIIEHPDPDEIFRGGDVVYVLGKPEQVANAIELFSPKNKM